MVGLDSYAVASCPMQGFMVQMSRRVLLEVFFEITALDSFRKNFLKV